MSNKSPLTMEVIIDASELQDVTDDIKSSIKEIERQVMMAKVCALASTTLLFAFIVYRLAS